MLFNLNSAKESCLLLTSLFVWVLVARDCAPSSTISRGLTRNQSLQQVKQHKIIMHQMCYINLTFLWFSFHMVCDGVFPETIRSHPILGVSPVVKALLLQHFQG